MTENQKKAREVMNLLYALEAKDTRKSKADNLVDQIALLRDAFLDAVPDARNDHRFGEMMGSPESVLFFVTKYLRELV